MICATNSLSWLKTSSKISHDSFFSHALFGIFGFRNDIFFNNVAPNLQIVFSIVHQSIALWLWLDSSSLKLNIENIVQ